MLRKGILALRAIILLIVIGFGMYQYGTGVNVSLIYQVLFGIFFLLGAVTEWKEERKAAIIELVGGLLLFLVFVVRWLIANY